MSDHGSHIRDSRTAWDEADVNRIRSVSWLSLPAVTRLFQRSLPSGGIVPYIEDLLLETSGKRQDLEGAAVVCGDMESERGYFENMRHLRFSVVDGFDLSPKSLDRVRPASFTFRPRVCDCNDLVLEAEKYDLVVASHGLHHVQNVGGLLYQIHKALRPGGVFFLNEWIGPERLGIPKRNAAWTRLLLWLLFRRRERTTHEGRVKGLWLQHGPESFDPSEACNSTEILPQLKKYFRVSFFFPYGTLAYPAFEGTAANLSDERRFDRLRTEFVIRLESILTSAGLAGPLFAMAVAVKAAASGSVRESP